MKYICVDPSGNFNSGKGHTGIAIIEDNDWNTLEYKSFSAKDYPDRHSYWSALAKFIINKSCVNGKVIIESFMIQTHGFLIGTMPETIQFIGFLSYELEDHAIPYIFQTPTQAKSRFKDDTLDRYIPNFEKRENGRYYLNGKLTNDHIRDALKHLLYYQRYSKDKA